PTLSPGSWFLTSWRVKRVYNPSTIKKNIVSSHLSLCSSFQHCVVPYLSHNFPCGFRGDGQPEGGFHRVGKRLRRDRSRPRSISDNQELGWVLRAYPLWARPVGLRWRSRLKAQIRLIATTVFRYINHLLSSTKTNRADEIPTNHSVVKIIPLDNYP